MNLEKFVLTYVLPDTEVSALDSNDFLPLSDVFSQKEMPVTTNNISKLSDVAQWAYLSKVKCFIISSKVELLIGTTLKSY